MFFNHKKIFFRNLFSCFQQYDYVIHPCIKYCPVMSHNLEQFLLFGYLEYKREKERKRKKKVTISMLLRYHPSEWLQVYNQYYSTFETKKKPKKSKFKSDKKKKSIKRYKWQWFHISCQPLLVSWDFHLRTTTNDRQQIFSNDNDDDDKVLTDSTFSSTMWVSKATSFCLFFFFDFNTHQTDHSFIFLFLVLNRTNIYSFFINSLNLCKFSFSYFGPNCLLNPMFTLTTHLPFIALIIFLKIFDHKNFCLKNQVTDLTS